MTQDGELYETRGIKLERGEQLEIVSGSRAIYVRHSHAGLHVSRKRHGRVEVGRKCVACGSREFELGCARNGCPNREK